MTVRGETASPAEGVVTVQETERRRGRDDRARNASIGRTSVLHDVVGVTGLAAVVLDGQARVTHWSAVATELFGIAAGDAVGFRLPDLLRAPAALRGIFDPRPGGFAPAWAGGAVLTPVRGGRARDVLCWAYPLDGPGTARLLVVCADGRRLRADGPGLAAGDALIAVPGEASRGGDPVRRAVHMLRVEPVMLPPGTGDAGQARRIAAILPSMGPRLSGRIAEQVLAAGYPAAEVSVTARLPLAPYWGGAPRLLRVRPGGAAHRSCDDAANADPAAGLVEQDPAKQRLTFLNRAGVTIGATPDLAQTAVELCEVMVPYFTDFAGVQLREEVLERVDLPTAPPTAATRLRRVAVTHNDEPGRWDDVVPVGETLLLPADTPFVRCMTTGAPVNVPHISAELSERIAGRFDDRDLRPLLDRRSMMVLPLTAGGTVLGNVVLLRRGDRAAFDDLDVATAEDLARRTSLAMDNARLYHHEADTAHVLQRSMLARRRRDIVGVDVAHRYLPSQADKVEVGGDWFDTIPLPGSRVALVVGDVMGHGLHAAAVMGQFRTGIRTLASMDLPPEQVLRHLDDLAQRLGEDYPAQPGSESHLATCLYAVYDPVTRRCEIANAGHIPPVLVHPDGRTELLELPSGAPIGVGGVAFETAGIEVEDGAGLVLCTDGLVEIRGRDIGLGLASLCREVAGPAVSLEDACEAVVHALWTPERADDVALLMARFHGIPGDDVATWTLPNSDPRMVGEARRYARRTLHEWRLDHLSESVELLVSELVTNAILHGSGQVRLRLLRAGRLLCEVHDNDHALPVLVASGPEEENGRGIQLVSRLAERWGTSRTALGKVVWFEQPLRTPANEEAGELCAVG